MDRQHVGHVGDVGNWGPPADRIVAVLRVDQRVDGERAGKIAIGHGMTTWWKSEIEFEWEKEPAEDEGTHYTEVEWVNVFQLSEPGQYGHDVGFVW